MRLTAFIRLAWFFLPLAVVCALVELRLSHTQGNIYGDKEVRLRERSDLTSLVLGSSHGMFSVPPAHLPGKGFNLAFPSETPEVTKALFAHYLPHLPKLETVYYSLSYFVTRARLSDSPTEDWRLFSYRRILGAEVAQGPWSRLDLRNYLLYFALTPAVAKALLRGKTAPREWDGMLADGYIPLPDLGVSMRTQAVAQSRHEHYRKWMRTENRAGNVAALTEVARTASARGIRLVFFTPPVLPVFIAASDPVLVAERQALAAELKKEFPSTVSYLDYFNAPGYSEDQFYDPDHLNSKGAEIFSARLVRDAGREMLH